MREVIVDTNVPLMADGGHMSLPCQANCANFIESIIYGQATIVIDDQWRIIREYENKIPNRTQGTVSRTFLKHVLTNQGNPDRVKQVAITPFEEEDFDEFPQSLRDVNFDMSDRKFVAICISNGGKAPIVQAADSKWIGWEQALKAENVNVQFLCRAELEGIFNKKMS